MNMAAFYSAIGATIVLAGSAIQFLRDARNLSGEIGAFNSVHEALVIESVRDRRRKLHWWQFVRWHRVPRAVRQEIRDSLPPGEVIVLKDVDRFSRGWALVAVGSLAAAIGSWWQVFGG